MTKGLVSVIIPTYNSAAHLAASIESIRKQTYEQIEIVVADNHSCDGTVQLAERLADKAIFAGPERCAQCNAAVRASSGEFIYRVDGDFIVEPTVVAAAVAACKAGAHAVQVHNDSDPSVGFWASVRHFERRMYRNDDMHVGARFFRRGTFEAVGGFDEALVAGEDYDLHNRLLRAGYNVEAIEPGEKHLGEPRTLAAIAEKSFFYGRSTRRFLARNGTRGFVQMNPVRATYFRHWRCFVAQPRLALAFIAMQVVKYAFGSAGLAFETLRNRGSAY